MSLRTIIASLLPALFAGTLAFAPAGVQAADLISVRKLTLQMAGELARQAVQACAKAGYQVTAVVVDREGIPQVMMRNTLAPRFTIQIARDKANAVILSGVSSGAFRTNRADIRMEMDHVHGVLVLQGGVPIRAAGSLVGALGVSGAPGGDKDEACARQAVDALRDRLEFAN
ncbi:MAG: heme-binding protein [Gammaproteobacteria bacterium]